jgi:hypothetical protein
VFKSTDNRDIFLDNQSYSFKIQIATPLNQSGRWNMALLEFHCDNDLKDEQLYIYSSICAGTVVGGNTTSLLRWIPSICDKSIQFHTLCYIPIVIRNVNTIEFDIRDKDNRPATFLKGPATLSVLFQEQ